ncbi:MAG: aspartate dehydrogenase [Thiothrix sp.]|nr:MAG: aspartate dehydrogenase [Thiothrix sp.]
MKKNILLIGHGAMARKVLQELPDHLQISHLLIREAQRAETEAALAGSGIHIVTSLEECEAVPDFALECAGHGAVEQYGAEFLAKGIDFGVVSVGALANKALMDQLEAAAQAGKSQLHILAGAVAGIDALAAAREGGLDEVIYSSCKPPLSWLNSPAEQLLDLKSLTEPTAFYEGNAREAARQFPANANVAATIALAGLGFEKTRVRLVADPTVKGNVHRIHARGSFGEFDIELRGKPLVDNPKTSTLAALSAVRALRHGGDWIVI